MVEAPIDRRLGRMRASVVGAEVRREATVIWLLTAILLLQWPLAAIFRIAGTYVPVSFLQQATISDAGAAALIGLALLFSAKGLKNLSLAGWLMVLITLLFNAILWVQYLFGPPEVEDTWLTREDEVLRTGVASVLYLVYIIAASSKEIRSESAMKALGWAIYWSGLICFVIAVLQSFGMLNNLYFQWYGRAHLPRPAGGFVQPHFFATICIIAAVGVILMARRGYLRMPHAFGYAAVMFLGTAISTSRVGVISALIAIAVYLFMETRRNPAKTTSIAVGSLVTVVLGILALAVFASISEPVANAFRGVTNAYEVFSSPFRSDDNLFRGRDALWAHELQLIQADFVSLMFGYGYQPFVSHNLVLRQLQVSGVFGALLYFGRLGIIIWISIAAAKRSNRDLIIVAWIPIFIALNTLPILISLAINVALVSVALLAQPGQEPSAGRPVFASSRANARRRRLEERARLTA